jgi:hypothetical protein
MGLFPSSGEGNETPTFISPLERANLIRWTTQVQVQVQVQAILRPTVSRSQSWCRVPYGAHDQI